MRKNAGMDAQALLELWATDRDAALLEWTYRALETPAAMEDAIGFSEWMVRQWYGPTFFSGAMSLASEALPLRDGRRLQFTDVRLRIGDEHAELFPARALCLLQQGVIRHEDFLEQLRAFLLSSRS